MADAKVQIGLSTDFLEGTSVNTPAGDNLFREGVVISDPEVAAARARITNAAPNANDYALAVRVIGNLTLGSEVEVKNDAGNPIPVSGSVAVSNFPATQATTDSTDVEYTSVATTVTAIGDTTIYTPAAGKRVRLHWIYALNDPNSTASTKITVRLGAQTFYVAWAISKRQQFTGPVNGPLVINLSQAGDVAVTAFVSEV